MTNQQKRLARNKATKKARAKREFARRHNGLNIWAITSIYGLFTICGGVIFFYFIASILAMGA
nr:hypothetical protein [uncultured Mediterranean phage uvMED]